MVRKATIKDVAALAGVSTATVSHVINNTRKVGDDTIDRVMSAIKELNYYPNRLVGSLHGKGTYTVGMVIPNIANETFGKIAEKIQMQLFDLGYNLIVCNTAYDPVTEEKALDTLLTKKIDAVIAIPASQISDKLREIQSYDIPVILVDRIFADMDTDTVIVDNRFGEYELVNYLIRLGHRNIGYVDRMVEQSHSIAQREGYFQALRENGIEPNPNYVIKANGHFYKAGIDAAYSLMQQSPEITAIAGYYDLVAFGVMRGLFNLGYDVPGDVSLVGYDNMEFTEATYPSLTTVMTPVDAIAEETCKILQFRLDEKTDDDNKRSAYQHIVLPPKLIIRESVSSRKKTQRSC